MGFPETTRRTRTVNRSCRIRIVTTTFRYDSDEGQQRGVVRCACRGGGDGAKISRLVRPGGPRICRSG
jgi:hypothetical protein